MDNSKDKLRVVGYARSCTDENIAEQVELIKQYVQTSGEYLLTDLITDANCSGLKRIRTGYEKLVSMMKAHEIDIVLCADVARITRSSEDMCNLVKVLRETGVKCYFIKNNITLPWSCGMEV